MIVQLATAFGVSIGLMVLVGTVVKGGLGMRSLINWFVQTAVIALAASLLSFTTPQVVVALATPAVIHLLVWGLNRVVGWRTKRGDYGEEAQWAYELFEDNDQEFMRAQTALPQTEVMEVTVIADSKQELREKMIERYEELSSEQLSSGNTNY